jgi:hypothetical protein
VDLEISEVKNQLIVAPALMLAVSCSGGEVKRDAGLLNRGGISGPATSRGEMLLPSSELLATYTADQTVFPSLKNFCNPDKDVLSSYEIPYNTFLRGMSVWGYFSGTAGVSGCGTDQLELVGRFSDLRVLKASDSRQASPLYDEVCTGELTLKQDGSSLHVSWKMDSVSPFPDSSHRQCKSPGQTESIVLQKSTLNELKTHSLSFYEYHLTAAGFAIKVLPSGGLFLVDSSLQKKSVSRKQGSKLRKKYCDRGGADFPEAGICYRLDRSGGAYGFVTDGSSDLSALPFGGGFLPLSRLNVSLIHD